METIYRGTDYSITITPEENVVIENIIVSLYDKKRQERFDANISSTDTGFIAEWDDSLTSKMRIGTILTLDIIEGEEGGVGQMLATFDDYAKVLTSSRDYNRKS